MRTRIALIFIFTITLVTTLLIGSVDSSGSTPSHGATQHGPKTVETLLSQNEMMQQRRIYTTTTTAPPVVTTAPPITVPVEAAPVPSSAPLTPVLTGIGEATPDQVAAWQQTAICETSGDWGTQGSVYSGGLGFANSTWVAYGGLQCASNAGLATPAQQVAIALRIRSTPPDVGGCFGGW